MIYAMLLAASCQIPILIGFDAPLTMEETRAMKRAQFVCSIKYRNSPCLVKFKKVDKENFHAICGAKR